MINKVSHAHNQLPDLNVNQVKTVQNNVNLGKQTQTDQPKSGLSKEKAEKVISSINEFLEGSNTQLVYKYHEGLQEFYATVVDENSKQVIREIPAKRLLDIFAAMKEYTGLLVDRKA